MTKTVTLKRKCMGKWIIEGIYGSALDAIQRQKMLTKYTGFTYWITVEYLPN